MRITIVGCGNAGSAMAADLSNKGHDVTILKTSHAMHNEHFSSILKTGTITLLEDGAKTVSKITATTDFSTAFSARDVVVVFVQTNYHEELIRKISRFLEDGQIVLIEPGYLSTCYFLKYCEKKITIVEAESSPIDCRITAPGVVSALFRNVRNPIGVYPKSDSKRAMNILSSMDYSFELVPSVIDAALHNPNLIVHTIGAVMSVPRIEYVQKHGGSYSMYREAFTPYVWRLVEALDAEKMNVLEAIGSERLSYVAACKYRNSLDNTRDALEVFFDYANNSAPGGPDTPDSRYITEDVPQGLVMLESLGQVLRVDTPICSSLISLASTLLNVDFRANGRTVERLDYSLVKKIVNDSAFQKKGRKND